MLTTPIVASGCNNPKEQAAGVHWEQKIEVATGGGYRGPWRMNRSEFRYVDDPHVDLSRDGVPVVTWVDQSRKDIFIQFFETGGTGRFDTPVNVSKTPGVFSWFPDLVVSRRNPVRIYVLWQEIVFSGGSHGGEIFFARSTDGGQSFHKPLNLSNSIAGDGKGRLTRDRWDNGSLDLIQGPEGHLYAAWTEYEGNLWFSRSMNRGKSFSKPIRIAEGSEDKPTRGPSLAVDGIGRVYIVWTVGEDEEADIRFRTLGPQGGSPGETRVVFDSEGHSDAPKIAVAADGTLHLVYGESPSGPLDQYHVRYTRSRAGQEGFEPPVEISEPHSEQYESVNYPSLGLDGQGNLFATWELYPNRPEWPRGIGITISRDGGNSFSDPSLIPGSTAGGYNGSLQGKLAEKLAVHSSGTIAVVNSTFKPYQESYVWLFLGGVRP